jgi:hypothetical protein
VNLDLGGARNDDGDSTFGGSITDKLSEMKVIMNTLSKQKQQNYQFANKTADFNTTLQSSCSSKQENDTHKLENSIFNKINQTLSNLNSFSKHAKALSSMKKDGNSIMDTQSADTSQILFIPFDFTRLFAIASFKSTQLSLNTPASKLQTNKSQFLKLNRSNISNISQTSSKSNKSAANVLKKKKVCKNYFKQIEYSTYEKRKLFPQIGPKKPCGNAQLYKLLIENQCQMHSIANINDCENYTSDSDFYMEGAISEFDFNKSDDEDNLIQNLEIGQYYLAKSLKLLHTVNAPSQNQNYYSATKKTKPKTETFQGKSEIDDLNQYICSNHILLNQFLHEYP